MFPVAGLLFGELDDLSRCDDSYFGVERTESVGVFLRVDIDDCLRTGEVGVFVHLGYGIGFYRLFGAASDSENLRGQRLSVGRTDHSEILLRKDYLSLRLVQIRRKVVGLTASRECRHCGEHRDEFDCFLHLY